MADQNVNLAVALRQESQRLESLIAKLSRDAKRYRELAEEVEEMRRSEAGARGESQADSGPKALDALLDYISYDAPPAFSASQATDFVASHLPNRFRETLRTQISAHLQKFQRAGYLARTKVRTGRGSAFHYQVTVAGARFLSQRSSELHNGSSAEPRRLPLPPHLSALIHHTHGDAEGDRLVEFLNGAELLQLSPARLQLTVVPSSDVEQRYLNSPAVSERVELFFKTVYPTVLKVDLKVENPSG